MIEDKEAYYKRLSELANKKDILIQEISSVEAVENLMRAYGNSSLPELNDRLDSEYNVAVTEYNEFTREVDETFNKICAEFGSGQVQNWIVIGYDMIDLVNLYLSGQLKKE